MRFGLLCFPSGEAGLGCRAGSHIQIQMLLVWLRVPPNVNINYGRAGGSDMTSQLASSLDLVVREHMRTTQYICKVPRLSQYGIPLSSPATAPHATHEVLRT